ncbi:MAG: cytochrome b/b6 domain-containing protein [Rhodocyclaceae bacterium]|nr:cytochrome b/b6 domain-containing protein [Rhodocyclaceae bacterium]
MDKVLIWDWPVRIGHWLLVGAFALAWITGDSEEWRLVHAFAGGTVVGVILFRLLWGLVGTRHARFASFVRGPRAALDYVLGLLRGDASQYAGHNAAGGWAIVALLTLGLLTGASGWLTYQDIGGEWLEEVHEALATGMLAVAAVHVAGVVVSSLAHRENLLRSMLTGLKQGRPDEAIANARPLVLVVLLGWVVACAWWLAR